MNSFGVREVPTTTKATPAPGWAYVPDTGIIPSPLTAQPTSRKRARHPQGASAAAWDATTPAKQDARLLRELAALDRENNRDVAIAVPPKHADAASRAPSRLTPAVRKILLSHKTFANHLADFAAAIAIPPATPTLRAPAAAPSTARARSQRKRADLAPKPALSSRKSSLSSAVSRVSDVAPESSDRADPRGPRLSEGGAAAPLPHPADLDPLFVSHVPVMPSAADLAKLLAHPPLSYFEACGPWVAADRRKPVRVFCERCGYWGRIKCLKCGGRVCASECYSEHTEDCLRYGP